jgi:hypothetical protein
MAGIPTVARAEIDRLATEWCKAKHVVVMLDDVAKQFATDVANLILKNYLEDVMQRVAAKKAAATGASVPTPDAAPAPPKAKSSLVLTDM